MAEMFYSIDEAAAKLGKSKDELKQLVQSGKLREYLDGKVPHYKRADIDALAAASPAGQESAISLTPLEDTSDIFASATASPDAKGSAAAFDLGDDIFDLSKDDTQLTGQGISVLSESDAEFKLTDDTMGKTAIAPAASASSSVIPLEGSSMSPSPAPMQQEPSLEKIEEDVNLDSFGSGSGLLDLSLQADDTSLGNVLDEIYPGADIPAAPAAASGQTPREPEPVDVAAEAQALVTEPEPQTTAAFMAASSYAEPEADKASNALGFSLFIPLLVAIYTLVIVAAVVTGVVPSIMTMVQDYIWYAMGGAAALALIIAAVGLMGSSKGSKPAKAAA